MCCWMVWDAICLHAAWHSSSIIESVASFWHILYVFVSAAQVVSARYSSNRPWKRTYPGTTVFFVWYNTSAEGSRKLTRKIPKEVKVMTTIR